MNTLNNYDMIGRKLNHADFLSHNILMNIALVNFFFSAMSLDSQKYASL